MQDATSISLAGSYLEDVRHVCAFFGSDDEEYEVLLPFMKDGFVCGDRAIHVVNPDRRTGHLQRLTAAGIDTRAAEQSGQFELWGDADTYLHDGQFDQDRMLAFFEQLARGPARHNFPRSRIVCRMDWAAESRVFVDNVIEFESRVNDVWRDQENLVICSYHLRHFSGDAVIDILRTHPMVIIGGLLHRNPFFLPPAQFLAERRQRQAAQAARAAGV